MRSDASSRPNASSRTTVAFAKPVAVDNVINDADDAVAVVHAWAAFDGFVDGSTLYTELAVLPDDTPASLISRWQGYLLPDLASTAKESPSEQVVAVEQAARRGEFKIVAVAYEGTSAGLSRTTERMGAAPYSAVTGSDRVATPLLPPDRASDQAITEACS
jgi:hypothetical protein